MSLAGKTNEHGNETSVLLHEKRDGNHGRFEITITVGATKLPNLEIESIQHAAYDAAKAVTAAVMEQVIRNDPEQSKFVKEERTAMLSLFDQPIFVEEIPNGYCSDYCCKHRPWFIVTTSIGRFKIGSRKRVILIDWSETLGTKTADELFAKENVTKGERMIHAWSLDNARGYVGRIVSTAGPERLEVNKP